MQPGSPASGTLRKRSSCKSPFATQTSVLPQVLALTHSQSPTLNARPIVRAIKQACRRGVEVILLLDLGFNDKGESIPFQGGTNEEVVDRLYKTLGKEKKEQHLKVYWYTGKDQVRPLNAVKKQRNCHIKFAAYDDEVLIIGNGNQDSQSWFHSQEVNVMVDSKVCFLSFTKLACQFVAASWERS